MSETYNTWSVLASKLPLVAKFLIIVFMKNSYPLFVVSDITESSKFFVEKFDYEAVFQSDWYIQLAHQDQQLGLMIKGSANQPKFLHQEFAGRGAVLTIEVEDVDKVYKTFAEEEIIYSLVTEEWGQRHFIVKAPGNIVVDVVNYTEPEDYS